MERYLYKLNYEGMSAYTSMPGSIPNPFTECLDFAKYDYEAFPAGQVPANALPVKAQAEALDILSCYNQANIYFERGEFHVVAGVGIKSEYAPDHCVCGTYRTEDFSPAAH